MEKSLKVFKKKAESSRQKLVQLNYIDNSRKIISTKEFVYFPIKDFLKSKINSLGTISSKKLQTIKTMPHSLSEILSKKLTKKELTQLKKAFDIFGDIIILEVPPELKKKEKLIGDSLLKLYKNRRAVFKKTGAVKGIARVRPLKRIAGTGTSEVIYKEHGCTFKFDIGKMFFTPRLATERKIIADKVKPNETVLCMFAGVGPFAILIAKTQTRCKVIALDINKSAIDYLKINANLNKVSERISAYAGDSKILVPKKFKESADRIIMNLPKTSLNFLPTALKALNKNGGIIHYYTFKATKQEVSAEVKSRLGDKKHKILAVRKVKPYAPREYCFCADIKIYK